MDKKILYIDMDGVLVDLGSRSINSLNYILTLRRDTKIIQTTYKEYSEMTFLHWKTLECSKQTIRFR